MRKKKRSKLRKGTVINRYKDNGDDDYDDDGVAHVEQRSWLDQKEKCGSINFCPSRRIARNRRECIMTKHYQFRVEIGFFFGESDIGQLDCLL